MTINIFKLYKIKKLSGAPELDFSTAENVSAATYKLSKDEGKVRTKIINLNKPMDNSEMKNEELVGNQHKLDYNKDGKISADDLQNIRKKKLKSKIDELKKAKNDPCWKGYVQLGMKDKDGKKVPNCVPESAEELGELSKETLSSYYSKSIKDRFSNELKRNSEKNNPNGADEKNLKNFGDKIFKRSIGIERAKSKYLAKESINEGMNPETLQTKIKGIQAYNQDTVKITNLNALSDLKNHMKQLGYIQKDDVWKKNKSVLAVTWNNTDGMGHATIYDTETDMSEGFVPLQKLPKKNDSLPALKTAIKSASTIKNDTDDHKKLSHSERMDKIKAAFDKLRANKNTTNETHLDVGSKLNCGKEKLTVKKHVGKDGYLVKADESTKEPETTKDKVDIKLPPPVKGGKLHGEIPAGYKSNGKKMHGSMSEKDNK